MKYQIVCDHCGKAFVTEGDGGQTVECQCPHCGGMIRCKLPVAEKKKEKTTHASGCGIMAGVAMLVFVVVLGAMIVYSVADHDKAKPIEDPYQVLEDRPDTVEAILVDTVEPEPEIEEPVDTVVYEMSDSAAGMPDEIHEQHQPIDPEIQDSTAIDYE